MKFSCFSYLFSASLSLCFLGDLKAANKVSQASGNWSNSAVWGGTVPADNDDIVISSGTTVSINTTLLVTMAFGNITVEQGGSLVVGVNDVKLRIKGNIVNNGFINFWQSSTYQADIWLYGNSMWSGTGLWNLSNVNVQGNSLEPAAGLVLTLNGSLTAYAGSSFNKINRYPDITFYIQGTVNTMISSYPDFYYGNLIISKASTRTVSFSPSSASNTINLLGDLTLVNSSDRLLVESHNTLALQASVTGAGVIQGSSTSSLVVDNLTAPPINPLRILSGTHFKDFIINRPSGVTLSSGFVIREMLRLNNSSRLILPPQTLTLGLNGTSPTAGSFYGNGTLVCSNNSSMSIRGTDTTSVTLRFDQATTANYTINNLIVDKLAGTVVLESGNLVVAGSLGISDKNKFSIGAGTLILNVVPSFIGSGCLSGSRNAGLKIAGTGLTGYSLSFDQLIPLGNSLKTYTQSRNAVITLANKLSVYERVSLSGNSSVLVSNGNLTLLSSDSSSAGIGPLLNSTDVVGDVNVQVYFQGNNKDINLRGSRSLSSPINENLIPAGNMKSFQQLKDYLIITGPGGAENGFDQGGRAQPFAQTLVLYNELVDSGQYSFKPVKTIYESINPGAGFFAFFRGLQMGSYALNAAKLNAPFATPEPVTMTYKGAINKFDIPAIRLNNSHHDSDPYNGYNHIGNPYPSAIDWTKVTRSDGVNDEVIIIKPGGGTATYLNGFSNNGGSPYIQTGQGFYVRTSVDGSTVSFKEEAKTSAYPARLLNNPGTNLLAVNGQSSQVPDEIRSDCEVLKLNLEGGTEKGGTEKGVTEKDETTIVFKPGEVAEANYDDALYFGGSAVSLSSKSADEKKLAINFMPDIHLVKEIPLSVNASSSGAYKLNFTDVPGTAVSIFLKDSLQQDKLVEVKKTLCYSFSIDKNIPATFGDERFKLIFKSKSQNEPAVTVRNFIQAYPNPVRDQEVSFDGSSLAGTDIRLTIYDINGREVQAFAFSKGNKIKVNVVRLEPGMYVARFYSDPGRKALGETLFLKQ